MPIKQDQLHLSDLKEKINFHLSRGKGHIFSYLKNRIQWNYSHKFNHVSRFPPHVDIEISTKCNMGCPMCYRRSDQFKRDVPQQFMKKGLFEKIINECAKYKLFSIRLNLRGESFIHPDIFYFVELAKQKGIKEVSSLSNGYELTPDKFEKLVTLGFDWLTISIDGMDDYYEKIRKPAKFKEIFKKVKEFHKIKQQHHSKKPALRIQTLWPAIKDNPTKFYQAFSPYVDSITSNPLIDFLREDDCSNIKYIQDFICPDIYRRLVIGSDGQVILCTCDVYGEYIVGDVNKETIFQIWNGERLNQARNWFSKKTKNWWESSPCKHCCYAREKEYVGEAVIDDRKVDIVKYTNRDDELNFNNQEINNE